MTGFPTFCRLKSGITKQLKVKTTRNRDDPIQKFYYNFEDLSFRNSIIILKTASGSSI
jgi:hypothetical protein